LASGPVNSGQVKVELVTPTDKPPFVVVTWPLKPSAMSPAAYSDGLTPWSAFVDITETVPELAWPNSIHTYSAMRTDAQIASLLLAFTLPIRRYRWYIAPSGAGDEVVEDVANDFNSPIEGQDPKPVSRRRDRFQSRPPPVPRTADVDLGLDVLRAAISLR
jgi:hypothetical protein